MKLLIAFIVILLNGSLTALSDLVDMFGHNNVNPDCVYLNSKCEIKLLRNKTEKVDLLNICMNTTETSYLTIKDEKIDSIKLLKSCPFKNEWIIFGWIPFKKYKEDTSDFLKFKEYKLITRTEDTNKAGNYTYELYSNQLDFGLSNFTKALNTEILVEIIPSSYKLNDINYKLWKNTTLEFKVPMKNVIFKNYEYQSKHIVEDIQYSFNQTFKLNLTDILECDYNIPGKYEYDNDYVDLNKAGSGQFFRNKSFEFSYNLPPRSMVNVMVAADWVVTEYLFTSNLLFKYYDLELLQASFGAEINNKKITITRISNVHLIYDKPVFIDQQVENFEIVKDSSVNHQTRKSNYQQSPIERPILPEKPTEAPIEREIETNNDSMVNPGFEPYFIAGCIVVCVVLILACGGVTKSLLDDRRNARYKEVPMRTV